MVLKSSWLTTVKFHIFGPSILAVGTSVLKGFKGKCFKYIENSTDNEREYEEELIDKTKDKTEASEDKNDEHALGQLPLANSSLLENP